MNKCISIVGGVAEIKIPDKTDKSSYKQTVFRIYMASGEGEAGYSPAESVTTYNLRDIQAIRNLLIEALKDIPNLQD